MNWTFSSFSFFNLRKLYKFNHVTFHDSWYTSLCQIAEYDLISFFWAETLPQHSQALCSIRKWMIPKFMICTETSKTFLIIVGLFVDTMALTYVMRPRESFYIIMVLVVSLRSFGCVYSMTGFSLPWQYNVAFCLATCWYDGSKGYTAYVIFPLTSCLDFILLTFK